MCVKGEKGQENSKGQWPIVRDFPKYDDKTERFTLFYYGSRECFTRSKLVIFTDETTLHPVCLYLETLRNVVVSHRHIVPSRLKSPTV